MRPRDSRFRAVNAVLGGLLVAVMLGSSPTTAAYLTTTLSDASNVIGTAKQFTVSDLTAIAQPAGAVHLAWSAASWAAGGYSIRRGTSPSGPFSEITVVPAGVTAYTDTATVDATAYSYEVFGLSGAGGIGTGSTIASATADATSPRVTAISPASEATNVALNASVSTTFSEAMNTALTGASLSLVDCGSSSACASPTVLTSTQAWAGSTSVTVTPTATLNSNEWYGLSLGSGASDLSGNALDCTGASTQSGSTCYWVFQTGSSGGTPGLASMSPAAGASSVATNSAVGLQWTAALSLQGQTDAQNGFSLKQASGAGAPCYVSAGGGQTPLCAQSGGTWSNPFADASQFTPSNPLLASTSYTVAESASDAGVLSVSASATWTTAASTDTTAPTVTQVAPNAGASGISPSTSVEVSFSKAMDVSKTSHAFGLQAWSTAGACTGTLGAAVSGTSQWTGPSELAFYPSAGLTANTCYHVSVAATATDISGNALAAWGGSDFSVGAGTPPTVSLAGGDYYYPGASLTASGAGWNLGAGNVLAEWDDGSALDASGASPTSGSFSGYALNLPNAASAGSHTIWFTRAGGATIGVPISVQSPSRISLSAASTDISAGGSTSISANVYDQGQPAANARVTFSITTDAGGRGSFASGGSSTSVTELTDSSGKPTPVTLYVSSGGSFSPITVTATSGSATQTITIIDPAPLPPQAVQLSAQSGGLQVSWQASPSAGVADYLVSLGTSSGNSAESVHTGLQTTYTFTDVVPGQTYYVVVRASDAHGALSDPSPEVHLSVPLPTASPTATGTFTVTPTATATATAAVVGVTPSPSPSPTGTATPVPTSTATAAPTHTPTALPTATATATSAPTSTATAIPSLTATATASTLPTATATGTASTLPTATATATGTIAPTSTATSVPTSTATATALATSTATTVPSSTPTATVVPPTRTPTPLPTHTPTPAPTATPVSGH